MEEVEGKVVLCECDAVAEVGDPDAVARMRRQKLLEFGKEGLDHTVS